MSLSCVSFFHQKKDRFVIYLEIRRESVATMLTRRTGRLLILDMRISCLYQNVTFNFKSLPLHIHIFSPAKLKQDLIKRS